MQDRDLMARKSELRERMRRLRDSLSAHDINSKSKAIGVRLWRLIGERRYKSVMFYIAFGSEVRTQDYIARAIDSGKVTLVPACITDNGERWLIPCRLSDLASEVAEGTFGIPEPKPEFRRPFPPEKIDLVVVPGLAFDEKGYRIGYGAGYYDRFLARCPQALSVGLAYEMQIVETAFPTAWDIPVHKVITENRVICCRDGGI